MVLCLSASCPRMMDVPASSGIGSSNSYHEWTLGVCQGFTSIDGRRTWLSGVALLELPRMHPLLLWQPIIPTTCLDFLQRGIELPFRFLLAVEDVPGFGTDVLELLIDATGVSTPEIERCQRTFEA